MTLLESPPEQIGRPGADHSETSEDGSQRERSAEPRRARRMFFRRVVVVVLVLFSGWHAAATFLWVAPSSPLREVVPASALQSYMSPMFDQAWSVFAPEPIDGDFHLFVRATVEQKDGTVKTTGWVDAMSEEVTMLKGTIMQSRAGGLAHSQAMSLSATYNALSEAQKQIVAQWYFGEDWSYRLEADLDAVEGQTPQVIAYLKEEWRITAYSTQVAHAVWGDKVKEVQYAVTRETVVPFSERNNPDAVRSEYAIGTGWRGLIVRPGQNESAFADVFKSLNPKEEKRAGDE